MTDLNMMMREQARAGLQTQLDSAVTNGDVEAARRITDEIAKLDVRTAPKAPPYGDAEIRAELNKLDWFGVDPKKSARAMELGKHMDIKRFATAEAFAAALVKSVDEEFKSTRPPADTRKEGGDVDDEDANDNDTDGEDGEENKRPAPKPRRTDGPNDNDNGARNQNRRPSGPWVKISDAPADVQKEIKRSADKFLSSNASKEQREAYIKKALESHYQIHARNKGKK